MSHRTNDILATFNACHPAIPRIKLRRKAASETLRPLLEDLENVANLTSTRATQNEASDILSSISKLSTQVNKWVVSNVTDEQEDDISTCKVRPCFLLS